jgi:hypothetical protein
MERTIGRIGSDHGTRCAASGINLAEYVQYVERRAHEVGVQGGRRAQNERRRKWSSEQVSVVMVQMRVSGALHEPF